MQEVLKERRSVGPELIESYPEALSKSAQHERPETPNGGNRNPLMGKLSASEAKALSEMNFAGDAYSNVNKSMESAPPEIAKAGQVKSGIQTRTSVGGSVEGALVKSPGIMKEYTSKNARPQTSAVKRSGNPGLENGTGASTAKKSDSYLARHQASKGGEPPSDKKSIASNPPRITRQHGSQSPPKNRGTVTGTDSADHKMDRRELSSGKKRLISESVDEEDKYKRNRSNPHLRGDPSKSGLSSAKKSFSPSKRGEIMEEDEDGNLGHRLYQRGIRMKEETLRMLQEKRNEEIMEEEKEYTFKPVINNISKQIRNSGFESTEEYLIKVGEQMKERREKAKNMKMMMEVEGCSFKPQLNHISERINEEKAKYEQKKNSDRFETLFNDWKRKEARKRILKEEVTKAECSFHPQLNANTQSMSSNLPSFHERQSKAMHDKKEREKQSQHDDLLSYDPSTGQSFFKPTICRPPKLAQRENQNLPVWEQLYLRFQEQEKKRKDLYEAEQMSILSQRAKSNEKSTVMIETLKRKRLTELFESLDSDRDGLISATKVDISSIPTEALEIFAPLLCEMEEISSTLNLEEFIDASERLFKTLTVWERDNVLLNFKKKWEERRQTGNYTFHPEINKKSQKLAENLRPYGDKAIYDLFIQENRVFKDKMKEMYERKMSEEVRECSFRPLLISSQFFGTGSTAGAPGPGEGGSVQSHGSNRPGAANIINASERALSNNNINNNIAIDENTSNGASHV
eukprot:TRINITY_DN11408_c0_g1_i10.p1 TRINITY_DN11408_c0_g1~~TRINITY_DN11408_c0_g1_i10.p1  ORF type:complete len:745 (+),score=192.61 TRINITY_DN11408_c0_g1_i10:195-2429(+)